MSASERGRRALRVRRAGIDTYREPVIYMRADCEVCRAEGFETRTRVRVAAREGREILATLNVVGTERSVAWLGLDEAALSEAAWLALGVDEGEPVWLSHPRPLTSFARVRGKLFGHPFDEAGLREIVADVAARRYTDVELSAFLAACTDDRMTTPEVAALTRAMVATGEELDWGGGVLVDKHCVGGLPGNRTTPIVVAIVAAGGLRMPKTSSRAITSPAGTADVMETITEVELGLADMRRVVEREGACLAWGGSVALAPADDVLIRVERVLDLDMNAQLVASVLSKKLAAGAGRVLIDVPIGPTAKIRSEAQARHLIELLEAVARENELALQVMVTDGSQPVGRGIGPALEAHDVLAVLERDAGRPEDLEARAAAIAGRLLEIGGAADPGEGEAEARRLLASGAAWEKLHAICVAQGGWRRPPTARWRRQVEAPRDGVVGAIDCRRIARLAKLAGAPAAAEAGVRLHVHVGAAVARGEPLMEVHAANRGELDYALDYLEHEPGLITLTEEAP